MPHGVDPISKAPIRRVRNFPGRGSAGLREGTIFTDVETTIVTPPIVVYW
jgi:hypothetical protein